MTSETQNADRKGRRSSRAARRHRQVARLLSRSRHREAGMIKVMDCASDVMERSADVFESCNAHMKAQAAEIARLRDAKWIVRHNDTINDMVLMGMARDVATAERDAARAEIARLREALGRIARLEGVGGPDAELQCADMALAALAQETQP